MTDKAIKDKTVLDIRENPYTASKLKNYPEIDADNKIYKKRTVKKHSGNLFLILFLFFGILATGGVVFGVNYKTNWFKTTFSTVEFSKLHARKQPETAEFPLETGKIIKKDPVVPIEVKPPPLKVDKQEQTDLLFDDLKYNMVLQDQMQQNELHTIDHTEQTVRNIPP